MLDTPHLAAAVYAKTLTGQEEIRSRALGLSPLVRRTLVLVDGKRTGSELAVFLAGQGDVEQVLTQLLELGCIEALVRRPTAAVAAAPEPEPGNPQPVPVPALGGQGAEGRIPGLPDASTRSAKENDMARHFMINSVNAIIGQHSRISLVHDIFHAVTTEQLRTVYLHWESSMSEHAMGARRLPELREKLFKVL
jgi:hypothetical protein